MKEYALTRGGLGIDSVSMSQEVSRGHSIQQQRAVRKKKKGQRSHKLKKGWTLKRYKFLTDVHCPRQCKPKESVTRETIF